MSSRQKRKQARRNGALAAGTKSPEGIKQSSMNALAHGLTSKSIVLTNESKPAYDRLRLEYFNRFQPQDAVEKDLVDDMVGARWRLRRIAVMQTAALDLQMDKDEAEIKKGFQQIDQPTLLVIAFSKLANEGPSLQLLLRYETTYSRMFDRAMKALEHLQEQRQQAVEPETYEELRNEAPPEESTAVLPLDTIAEPDKLAEMITNMSPDELIGYLKDLKQQCEAQDPPPESKE